MSTLAELVFQPGALQHLRETMAANGYTAAHSRVDIEVLAGSCDHIDLASGPLWDGHYARKSTPSGECWHMLSLPLNLFDLKGDH